jgi:hypothetical protein
VYPNSLHPIVKNLGGIKFDFANPIDTLKNGIKKPYCWNPHIFKILNNDKSKHSCRKNRQTITKKHRKIPLSVIEGSFHSMFENRVLPFEQKTRFHTGQKKQDDCDF